MTIEGTRPTGLRWSPWTEARVTWLFVYRDLSASLIPACLFSLSASRYFASSPSHVLTALGQAFAWLALYIYTFCLSNQISGYEEDRLLKPYRPLVRGLVTLRGTWVRWAGAMLCFTLLGWWLDVLFFTLLWQVLTVLHNFFGWGGWGFTKNLVMVLGAVSELGMAWTLVGPLDATGWCWIAVISILFGALVVHIQDLRDLDGDRQTGRRTLPMIFGETATRRYFAVLLFIFPGLIHTLLYAPLPFGVPVILCDLAVTASCWTVAYRVVRLSGRYSDHKTYMGYTYIYCLVLGSGILVF
ncbi:UbiA family prenyltransferase [Streptomyces sp. NPDC057743]|uniref:UbiA family prenyltransferase n=1 Tax=Streptomyces sp. NPDC057743 TaxID=3346236 RepID=UPI0036C1C75C